MKSLTLRYSTATIRDLNDIREFLESALLSLGSDSDTAGDLVLAVNEAVTNTLLHGYQEQPGPVAVCAEADGHCQGKAGNGRRQAGFRGLHARQSKQT